MNEKSLKDRLKNIAHTENATFGEVLKRLELERFLIRLSRSECGNRYIFKGGLLLSWYIDIGRETKDIDFLAKGMTADIVHIENDMKQVCAVNVDDGFMFSFGDITPLEQPHMNYPGSRVNLDLKICKNIKDRIQLDIGVGDAVVPESETFPLTRYKESSLFEKSISLQVYPLEAIFAEKLETIISKGAANSRMKDYHDLYLLTKSDKMNDEKVISNISATFRTRGTTLTVPVSFTDADFALLQKQWTSHRRGLGEMAKEMKLPDEIHEVIDAINTYATKKINRK